MVLDFRRLEEEASAIAGSLAVYVAWDDNAGRRSSLYVCSEASSGVAVTRAGT
jgi:hypothetical protein